MPDVQCEIKESRLVPLTSTKSLATLESCRDQAARRHGAAARPITPYVGRRRLLCDLIGNNISAEDTPTKEGTSCIYLREASTNAIYALSDNIRHAQQASAATHNDDEKSKPSAHDSDENTVGSSEDVLVDANEQKPRTDDLGNSSVNPEQDENIKKDLVDEPSGDINKSPGNNDGTAGTGDNHQEEQAPPEDKIQPGLLPGPQDDVGEPRAKDYIMHDTSDSGWFAALVAIDGHLLPRFAPEIVKQIGMGKHAGLRVEVKGAMGEYTEPWIIMRFKTRHRNILSHRNGARMTRWMCPV
ncbi:hypothetical protein OCS_01791 [Ophiocordyceps sinensis CO18]|uniref:Uncharacterized protein n=1 Tax=Ophiocordyceps sinensis (strain Co18 / CGMCC 3.14243) TaxID=911162 RepID=T5AJB0_OPHSC|nr:hypothetical protein OCS_01791 [Ophiocordyceps sinensis CO18]